MTERHGLDPDRFRLVMGRLPTGVTVVTVRDASGTAHGMTANAVTSLSLDPPLLLLCVDRHALIHDLLAGADTLGVNVLAEGQETVARRFADRDRHRYEDHDGPMSPGGLPLIPGAIAHLDVRRSDVHAGGDHSIITGLVAWAGLRDGRPLCYFRSQYTGLRA